MTPAATPLLDALLAEMALPQHSAPDAGPEIPFSYEPFAMPVRAFATTLVGYEAELALIQEMDYGPSVPEYLPLLQAPTGTISTLALAEAGASMSEQLAGLCLQLEALAEGPGLPETLQWQMGLGTDFWLATTTVRAGAGLVAAAYRRAGREAFVLRKYAVGLSSDMQPADAYTNLLRLTVHALAAHLTGADTLHLPAFSAENSVSHQRIREQIHQIVAHESRVHSYGPALRGAFWPELLAARTLRAAQELSHQCPDAQALQTHITQTATHRQADLDSGTSILVGETKFANPALTIPGPPRR